MISKKSNNKGASGGHGMQKITIEYLMDCETFLEYSKGHVCGCPICGESYYLDSKHPYQDLLKLHLLLLNQGCPFCNNKQGLSREHLNWFLKNNDKVSYYDFEINKELTIKTLRKPHGWRPLNKTQIKEAYEKIG